MTQQDTQPPAETLAISRIKAMAITLRNSVVTFGGVTQESLHTRAADALDDYHAALTRRAGGDAWWTDAGSVKEARHVFQAGRAALLKEQARNTHLKGVYEPIIAALEPMLSTLAHLDSRPSVPATPKPPAGGDAGAVEACTCQYFPTHQANDCPAHGLEPPFDGVRQDTPKSSAGGDAETKGWDHRYRPLAWGEVILDTDECRRDDGTWVTGICVGGKAPDPAYTSHRVYRRLVAPPGGDAGAVERVLVEKLREVAALEDSNLRKHGYAVRKFAAEAADYLAALALPAPVVEGEIVPPENGEPDPEWRAIKRAIDQFAGRVPTISKHRALNNAHIRTLVDRLDAAGDHEAADTIVWQCWWRALDRERERFLMDDANERIAALSEGRSHG